jgi:hypothetical protein
MSGMGGLHKLDFFTEKSHCPTIGFAVNDKVAFGFPQHPSQLKVVPFDGADMPVFPDSVSLEHRLALAVLADELVDGVEISEYAFAVYPTNLVADQERADPFVCFCPSELPFPFVPA